MSADDPATLDVAAHVDVDGDGAVSAGDFVSTASTPLLAATDVWVTVAVRPV